MTETSGKRAMVEYALGYAKRGWRVFPLHTAHEQGCSCGHDDCSSVGKHPRTRNGVKDATTDREQIQGWWQHWPDANIGIATGQGLYVVDVDCNKDGSIFDIGLEQDDLETLVKSLTVRTGSGGYHFYLSYDPALWLPNTASKLGPAIDTRGEGGYVVAPPSRNGHGRYCWLQEGTRRVQPLPPALLAKLSPAPRPQEHSSAAASTPQTKEGRADALPHNAPAGAAQTAAASPVRVQSPQPACAAAQKSVANEARNNQLIRVAGKLRKAGLDLEAIRCLLLTYNEQRYGGGNHPKGPLPVAEIERTIFKSLARYEAQEQRPAEDLPEVEALIQLMSREIPEPVWIVPGLLAEGLTLIAGKSKAGKSWLMLALALTSAAGEGLALGRFPINAAEVLYLSLEDDARRLQARVRVLLDGQPVPPRFEYALRWHPLTAGGFAQLESYLARKPETRLVVIDTLAKVRLPDSGQNSNLYLEEYQLMGRLQSLALEHHLALVVIHHLRKLKAEDPFDEIAGSTGLAGAADTLIVLDRKRGHNDAVLHLTGRDIEEQKLALVYSRTACTWLCTGPAVEHQISQSKQEILALLEDNDAMTPKEIAQALRKPQDTVRMNVRRMFKEGLVVSHERGRYRLPDPSGEKGEKTIWETSDEERE